MRTAEVTTGGAGRNPHPLRDGADAEPGSEPHAGQRPAEFDIGRDSCQINRLIHAYIPQERE